MLKFSVKSERCGGCAVCVKDCPTKIIQLNDRKLPFIAEADEGKCMQCQHCLAICPKGAISILGLDPENSLPLTDGSLPEFKKMVTLAKGRRSVRSYQEKNVDPQLLNELLAAAANAPTGVNNRGLTMTVIDDREVLDWFRKKVMQGLQTSVDEGRFPERYAFLKSRLSTYFENKMDPIFRGAPHVLFVSVTPEAPCGAEDVIIALSYFELLAQSAGLGTVWCGLLKWALESAPELKALVGLPESHPYYCMLFGYPAIHYARTVQRDDAAVIKRVKATSG
jgi:NAD-dependent dihydropyrimidine dehydrogenase PreA subunit/nitroreductase